MLLCAWAYWPGLSGPFLFDDFGNLDVLGAYGRIDSWPKLLYFVTSGNADPIGRPVALLSFLIDAQSWPAAPWPFKRTNLILHLLNIALLARVVAGLQTGLQRNYPDLQVSPWTPALTAAFWGAHPFFVSTTLYVVQREAMLPMTFVLLALMAWGSATSSFADDRVKAGWAFAVLGFGSATLLAGLAKANGFLAPLLTALAYFWWLRPDAPSLQRRHMDGAGLLLLGVPSLLLLGFVVHEGWSLWSLPIAGRDWTLPQRLLSEPRALWTYVGRLILPRAGGGGVFVDDFVPSRNLFNPFSTLPAVLALAVSIFAGVALRHRFPIVSFAWLFFLAGQLLESTTVPLELYFEHRNYLPAMFLGWPLAHALLRPAAYPRYRAAFAVLLLAGLLLLTHQRALVWSDPALLDALSSKQEAGSARAQVSAARQEIGRGDLAGLARIRAAQEAHPDSVDVGLSAVGMECEATGTLSTETATRARSTLATSKGWNYHVYQWLQDAAIEPRMRRCNGFGLEGVSTLVTAAESNPQNISARRKRDLWHVRGSIALAAGRPKIALHWFDEALIAQPDPDYALVQAAALGDAGEPALGIAHLDHFRRIDALQSAAPIRDMPAAHRWLLRHYGYYRYEISYLRQQLTDAGRKPAPQRND